MAESDTTRFGLRQWSDGTDTPERAEFTGSFANIEAKAAGWLPDSTAAARPAASAANARFLHRATDTGQLSYSTGSAWVDIPSDADVTSASSAAVSSHEAAGNPHPTYLRNSQHTAGAHNALGIDHGSLAGLSDDDHPDYPLRSGARGFTGRVDGVDPLSPAHLSTKKYVDDSMPIGAVTMFAGPAAPAGGKWLLCDGQAVSRATYSALFSLIGTTYGSGDGTTTFNLPDLRQRFPLGRAASGTGSTLGSTGGAIDHTHSNPNTSSAPNHSHTNPSTNSGGSHSHGDNFSVGSETNGDGSGPSAGAAGAGHYHALSGSVSSGGSHSHSQGATGSDGGHDHTQGATGTGNPPYLVLTGIIKVL